MIEIDLNSRFLGIHPLELMENAGKACYDEIKKILKEHNIKKITIVCGLGNNGGDGFVVARYLAEDGYRINIILIDDPEKIKTEEARINFKRLLKFKNVVITSTPEKAIEELNKSELIIDAILGTGIKGELRGNIRKIVESINSTKAIKVSIDVPTGIGSKTFIRANYVITFHRMKKELRGMNVIVKDIGIPKEAEEFVLLGNVLLNLPNRDKDSYKGKNGKVLIIGGSKRYHGALIFSGKAALNSGCDLVYILAPRVIENTLRRVEDFILNIYEGEKLNENAVEIFETIYDKIDAILIGPGLGYDEEIRENVKEILRKVIGKKPVVIDADGIKCIRDFKLKNCVITPHRKEFEIISGIRLKLDLDHQKETVKVVSKKYNSVVLLKGRIDIISDGDRVKLNKTGNEGMTVGGTGDVLSGIITSLIAQGVDNFNAACIAAFVNGVSGDFLLKRYGYCFSAKDLVRNIKRVFGYLYNLKWKILKR